MSLSFCLQGRHAVWRPLPLRLITPTLTQNELFTIRGKDGAASWHKSHVRTDSMQPCFVAVAVEPSHFTDAQETLLVIRPPSTSTVPLLIPLSLAQTVTLPSSHAVLPFSCHTLVLRVSARENVILRCTGQLAAPSYDAYRS